MLHFFHYINNLFSSNWKKITVLFVIFHIPSSGMSCKWNVGSSSDSSDRSSVQSTYDTYSIRFPFGFNIIPFQTRHSGMVYWKVRKFDEPTDAIGRYSDDWTRKAPDRIESRWCLCFAFLPSLDMETLAEPLTAPQSFLNEFPLPSEAQWAILEAARTKSVVVASGIPGSGMNLEWLWCFHRILHSRNLIAFCKSAGS